MPEPECIARILELEYDRDIILALARPKLSCIETQKIQRRENKVLAVANRRQELTDLHDKWPEMVPQSVILTCLNCYYEASQWKTPLVCSICGQYREHCDSHEVSKSLTGLLDKWGGKDRQALRCSNFTIISEEQLTGRGTNSWFITDLPDPDWRYAGLLAEYAQELQYVKVVSPDVCSCNGTFIHAGEYATTLKDGDVIEVEVSLKLYIF